MVYGLIATYLPHLLLRDIAGGRKIHEETWSSITAEVQRFLLGAEAMAGVTQPPPLAEGLLHLRVEDLGLVGLEPGGSRSRELAEGGAGREAGVDAREVGGFGLSAR